MDIWLYRYMRDRYKSHDVRAPKIFFRLNLGMVIISPMQRSTARSTKHLYDYIGINATFLLTEQASRSQFSTPLGFTAYRSLPRVPRRYLYLPLFIYLFNYIVLTRNQYPQCTKVLLFLSSAPWIILKCRFSYQLYSMTMPNPYLP